MMRSRLTLTAIGLACAAWTGIHATAAMVDYKILNDTSLIQSFDLHIDGNVWNDSPAGGLKLEKQSGDPSLPATYISVCTDINGLLVLGEVYGYDVTSFSGQSGIDPSWGSTSAHAAQAIQNAAHLFVTQNPGSGGSATAWAALQLAIWEALYDTGGTFDLTSGRFSVTGNATALAQAQDLLTGLAANLPSPGTYSGNLLLPNPLIPNGQGYPAQGLLLTPVPEPASIIAGVFLILPLGVAAVRRFRGNTGRGLTSDPQ